MKSYFLCFNVAYTFHKIMASLDRFMKQRITTSLSVLSEKSIIVSENDYIAHGGYNMVFHSPVDSNSVIRIFFQSDITTHARMAYEFKRFFNSSYCIHITDISTGYYNHVPYYYMIVPKATPLWIITSAEMATKLTVISSHILDELLTTGFYCMDFKTSNFGKCGDEYKFIDIDFGRSNWKAICPRSFRNEEIDEVFEYVDSVKVLGYSTLLYAFVITLKRFCKRPDGTYGGETFEPAQFVRVLKYVLGIRFMQEYIINELEYFKLFGKHLSECGLSEEEIDAANTNKSDVLTDEQRRINQMFYYSLSNSGHLFVSSAIHELLMTSDLDLSEITCEMVLSMIPKDEDGNPMFPSNMSDESDRMYRSACKIFHGCSVKRLLY